MATSGCRHSHRSILVIKYFCPLVVLEVEHVVEAFGLVIAPENPYGIFDDHTGMRRARIRKDCLRIYFKFLETEDLILVVFLALLEVDLLEVDEADVVQVLVALFTLLIESPHDIDPLVDF